VAGLKKLKGAAAEMVVIAAPARDPDQPVEHLRRAPIAGVGSDEGERLVPQRNRAGGRRLLLIEGPEGRPFGRRPALGGGDEGGEMERKG